MPQPHSRSVWLDDGDTFEVDTLEMADMLRAFEAH